MRIPGPIALGTVAVLGCVFLATPVMLFKMRLIGEYWFPAAKEALCSQKVIFAPQPDITPYELAQLQTKVASLALQICVASSDPIPAEMARHFRMVP